MKRIVLLCLVLVWAFTLAAQNERSALGRFSVNYSAGCTPFQVTVQELIPLGQTFYTFTNNLVSTKQHTYNAPGQYTIYQFIQDDDNPQGKVDSVKINIRAPQQPDFNIFTCPGNFVAVEVTDTYYSFYRAYFSPTDSVQINSGVRSNYILVAPSNPSEVRVKGFFSGGSPSCASTTKTYTPQQQIPRGEITTVTSLTDTTVRIDYSITANADYFLEKRENNGLFLSLQKLNNSPSSVTLPIDPLKSPCFRITTKDACSGSVVAGDTVCSVSLRAVSTTNGNQIRWNAPANPTTLSVLKKNDSTLFQGSAITYFDTDLLCKKEDCYTLVQGKAVSNKVCITANRIFNLGPPKNMQSTFDGDELVLSWDIPGNPPIREYLLGVDQGSRIITSPDYEYRLKPDLTKDPQRFNINYRDECNNISSFSNSTVPIYFYAELLQGNTYLMSWTPYVGWPEGVSRYYLERQEEDDSWTRQALPLNSESIEIALTEISNTFRVVADADTVPVRRSISNTISIGKSVLVSIPSAFTPDGNGLNDTFLIKAESISNYYMTIFNRWGEIVFESKDITVGWDGNYLGKRMLPGTFTYRLEFESEGGEQHVRMGNFVLIRQ